MRFKVLTYNIHKCIGGVDRRCRPERVIETIEHYEPDVVLLQEVDDGVPRSRRERQIDVIGDALGLEHRAFQPNVKLKLGVYGNAILSRWPLKDVDDVELTIWPKKRRRAQVAALAIEPHRVQHGPRHRDYRPIAIANLHLGLADFERRRQLRRLLESPAFVRLEPSAAAIIGGDFNDVYHNLGLAALADHAFSPVLGNAKTFPAALPLRCLDGIYYRGPLKVDRGFVGHTKLAKQASDHLPAIAEFKYRG